MIARVVRFYGIDPDRVLDIDNETVIKLSMAIEAIQAQETIAQLKVADWPNLKKEARNKLFRDLNKLANPCTIVREQKPLTTADLAALLNGR